MARRRNKSVSAQAGAYTASGIESYSQLIPVARELYEKTNGISWSLLLPLFALSVMFAYTSDLGISGAVITRIKKLILVCLLLVSFPTIAETIQLVGVELAKSIDDLGGIDQVLDAAAKQADTYSFSAASLLSMSGDLLIGVLVIVTYALL